MTETTLGRRIAQRRRMLSLSQEALGDKLEVSRQAISKWEADAAVPEVDRLVQMSKLFSVSVGWLLGTEATPPTETAPPDLTDTIAQTLRPAPPEPEPVPEPEPPASPTPPPTPMPTPRRWLLPVCATVTAASLVLSAISLSVALSPKEIPAPTTDPSLTAKLEDLTDQISTLKGDLERAHTRLDDMWDDNMELALRLHDLEQSGPSSRPDPTDPTVPSSGGDTASDAPYISPYIDHWSLTSSVDYDQEDTTLTFRCTTSTELDSLSFHIMSGEKMLSQTVCAKDGDTYLAQLTVPLRDDCRYYITLGLPGGTDVPVTLTDHGLEDLYSGYICPQIQATPNQTIFGNNTDERFWAGYDSILLMPPPLTPADTPLIWHVENISYLCNDVHMDDHQLSDLLTDDQRKSLSLNFSLPTQTFDLSRLQEGDVHQLRLMVSLTFPDDLTFSTILDLSTWIVKDGKLVLQ